MRQKPDDFMEEVKRDIEASRNFPKAVAVVTRESVAYTLWRMAFPNLTEIELEAWFTSPNKEAWKDIHDHWLKQADEFLLNLSKYPGEKT